MPKKTSKLKRLQRENMGLWREIVGFGKDCCEYCGKSAQVYQAHHLFTKGSSLALRYEPLNGCWLCSGCHFHIHKTGALEFSEWVINKMGADYYKLKRKKQNVVKNNVSTLEEIKAKLERQLEELNGTTD